VSASIGRRRRVCNPEELVVDKLPEGERRLKCLNVAVGVFYVREATPTRVFAGSLSSTPMNNSPPSAFAKAESDFVNLEGFTACP
jgi:hypothetical protein